MSLLPSKATDETARRENAPELSSILRAAAEGDGRAWDTLVLRFSPMIRRVARSYGLQVADVDDVTEATWLRFLQQIDAVHDAKVIGAWLTTVARRESVRLLRAQGHSPEVDADDLAEAVMDSESVAGRVELEEQRAAVERAMASLPERQRRLMELLLADDAPSYTEIATRLGIPVGSIGPTRGRALARLRQDPEIARALKGL